MSGFGFNVLGFGSSAAVADPAVDYLVIAAGGSGGNGRGAGGGAGGYRSTFGSASGAGNTGGGGTIEGTIEFTSGVQYTITVGSGGANV